MNLYLVKSKAVKITLMGVMVLFSLYAFAAPDNYVELGKSGSESSFDIIGGNNVQSIPIYNKEDYKNKAIGVLKPEYLSQPNEKPSKKESLSTPTPKQISKLEEKLRKLVVYPVPKYNFGKERTLKRKSFGWNSDGYKKIKSINLKRSDVPNLLQKLKELNNLKITQANEKTISYENVDQKVISQNEVDAIKLVKLDNFDFKTQPMHLKKPKDHDLLAADILFHEKKSCEEVVPISEYLADKKVPDHRVKYYRGSCLHKSKMFSESISLLSEVIGKSSDYYAKKAVDQILEGLPKGYESIIAKGLAPKNVYSKLDQKQKDKYNYILAKGNFVNENYAKSLAHAKLVSKESPDYNDAQFIVATSQYMSGKLREGIITLSALKGRYANKSNKNEDFMTLINVTYARFLFERGSYKEAIENYNLVSRDHSLWVDSLIEKGWAQIKLGDYASAIGNMFTLQSPFFANTFIPESYVIRTIGYLNLCQFGDADNTLEVLELNYPDQKQQITEFIKSDKKHYKTLLSYLESDVDKTSSQNGLPNSIIKEMGRDKDFLVIQTKLNNIVDEIPMFRKFASDVMDKRGVLLNEISKLTEKSKSLRAKEGEALKNGEELAAKEFKKQRKSVFEEGFSLKYRIGLFDKGIIAYKKTNGDAIKRAEKMRDGYLVQAEQTLAQSLKNLETRLNMVLTNNDLLRYEIFANSGKNIRYRAAGGNTEDEGKKPERTVASTKDYGWKYKGEFWQDEIGNFKSTIKNMCPRR